VWGPDYILQDQIVGTALHPSPCAGDPKHLNLRLEGDSRPGERSARTPSRERDVRALDAASALSPVHRGGNPRGTLRRHQGVFHARALARAESRGRGRDGLRSTSGPRECGGGAKSRKYGQIASGDGSKTHLTHGAIPSAGLPSSAEGFDVVRGPIGFEAALPGGDPGMPSATFPGPPETEVERRREARPRPEVEEEERPLHAATSPIGGEKGK